MKASGSAAAGHPTGIHQLSPPPATRFSQESFGNASFGSESFGGEGFNPDAAADAVEKARQERRNRREALGLSRVSVEAGLVPLLLGRGSEMEAIPLRAPLVA